MKLCARCGVPMVRTFSFNPKRNERFMKCPKCHYETPHVKMKEKDFEVNKKDGEK